MEWKFSLLRSWNDNEYNKFNRITGRILGIHIQKVSGSSYTMGDTLSVHQPYICIHQKYHLFPVKKVEVARFRVWIMLRFVEKFKLTFGPHLSCLVTQHISVRQYVHLTQSQPHFFKSITWQLGQFKASPVAIKPYDKKSRYVKLFLYFLTDKKLPRSTF